MAGQSGPGVPAPEAPNEDLRQDIPDSASPEGLYPADDAAQTDRSNIPMHPMPAEEGEYGNSDTFNKDNDLEDEPVDFSSDQAIREEIAQREGTAGENLAAEDSSSGSAPNSSGMAENKQDFSTGGPLDDKTGRRE